VTPLDKALKRALTINGAEYVVTLSPDSLKLTPKGKRLGMELRWPDLINGETALAVALQASVGHFQQKTPLPTPPAAASSPPRTASSATRKRPVRKK
jgi:hypothetical protein